MPQPMRTGQKVMTLIVPQELKSSLREEAVRLDRSVAWLIRRVLSQYIEERAVRRSDRAQERGNV